ncbi:MAG: chromosomal replication initiator protein DnaA [Clostridiales bacterium]|nr:chromosomal replication initiator protein DnaA [Clostridiales bacterium]
MNSYTEIWNLTLQKLALKYSSVIMDLFFKDTELIFLSNQAAVIQNQNDNLRTTLASGYADDVALFLSEVIGYAVPVFFESAEHAPVSLDKYQAPVSAPPVSSLSDNVPEFVEEGSDKYGNFFDSRYTFDNFIVGSSNTFAHAACTAVAREGSAAGYNPLFIYGDSGLGKTHLLYAVINETLRHHPDTKIVYAKGEDFTNEIIAAIANATTLKFREKYRKADMLLIDDIQFIAGKNSTQEEFFHTFNTLYEDNKQIVLTSDRPPKDIKPLEDRLKNRFEWGLLADIQVPDYELRIAIMQNKAKSFHADIPNVVFEFLAENLKSNVRQMEGAIKKIAAQSFLNNVPVTVDLAMHCISDIVTGRESDSSLVSKVISSVSKKYGVSEEEIRGKKRNQEIVRARNIAIYIIRNITSLSLPKIGLEFDRNHTTIMSSLSVIENEIKNKPLLELEIEELTKEIKE